jgi:predicted DNA-binding transcriptional regulator AlpA
MMKQVPAGYLSIREAEDRTSKHHTTLRRWWKRGAMPPPRRLGPNSIGFLESELDAWLRTRPVVGEPRDGEALQT